MGGSGGGGYFRNESPESVKVSLRREEQATANQTFEAEVSAQIGDLLSEYNDRDEDAVRRLLDKVKQSLTAKLEDISITPVFGGSVRKHTYVNGISDVDALLVLKGDGLFDVPPSDVLDDFEAELGRRFKDANLLRDRMSVTLEEDDLNLQLLPAVRKGKNLLIPSASGEEWSKVQPEAFFRKLTEINDQYGRKVVPTIKIVKGINDTFPEGQKLTGYHIESLAIEAFRDYTGPQNTKAMIEHFFDFAKDGVLSPIRDSTGQSVHVDGYAGSKRSDCRKLMAQNLDRVARRIKNANATHSKDKWIRILNQEEE
jgi:SMODS domain-containing protein